MCCLAAVVAHVHTSRLASSACCASMSRALSCSSAPAFTSASSNSLASLDLRDNSTTSTHTQQGHRTMWAESQHETGCSAHSATVHLSWQHVKSDDEQTSCMKAAPSATHCCCFIAAAILLLLCVSSCMSLSWRCDSSAARSSTSLRPRDSTSDTCGQGRDHMHQAVKPFDLPADIPAAVM